MASAVLFALPMDPLFRQQLIAALPRLHQLIDGFDRVRVLVIGDFTLDEFMVGQTERISREAPVIILRHEHTRQVPGGGANAVYNLAKLGAQVQAVGLVGDDAQGLALGQIFRDAGIDTGGMVVEKERPTVTKTRISGHARQSVTQQIVRIDRKSDDPPTLALQQALADYIDLHYAQVDAVVCSDYGDGAFVNRPGRSPVIGAALQHSRCIVDAQVDLGRYYGATLFTPNLPEAELAVGYAIDSPDRLRQAGADLRRLTGAAQMLITRGDEGMSLFNDQGMEHIPAFNRTDVFDVTGAGDTVVAALTLALCLGASFWEAALLGNLAASIVIRQVGTATTNPLEMKELLAELLEG
jgi:D-glycero-beta-D-manno-heptose-7-phosphate kinase